MKNHSLLDWENGSKTSRREFMLSSAQVISSCLLASCSNNQQGPSIPDSKPQPELDATLAFIGDSLTASAGGAQAYGLLVGKALNNRPVIIDAIGGQTAAQIAARQGGGTVTVSLEGDAFKGAAPVKVEKISNQFLSTAATTKEQNREATISGVKCLISRVGYSNPRAEIYTVKPDIASNASVPENSVIALDSAAKMKTATQVLWLGRNDVGSKTVVEDVTKSIEQCVAFISEPKRFVVLGVLPSVEEIKTTPTYSKILEINSRLQSQYASQFLPMLPPSPDELSAVGHVVTELDIMQIEYGVFPRGLRIDNTHLTDAGYLIVANRVIAKLKELNY